MVLCPGSWRKMPTYIGCCLHLCLCLLLRTHTFLGALLHFLSLRFLMWVPLGVPQQWPRHGKHWPANGANVEFFSNCFCMHWNLTWIDYSHALRIWEGLWTQIQLTVHPLVLFLDLLDLCLTSRYQTDQVTKRVPLKVLRHIPIIPHLQWLFMFEIITHLFDTMHMLSV
jgi:hypothetical protein